MKAKEIAAWCMLAALLLASCSVTKYVPDGESLLNGVKIVSHDEQIDNFGMRSYIRQTPNTQWFSLCRVPLHTYSLSGRDSTRWINRALRRLGEPPVIYSEGETRRTAELLTRQLQNEGYLHANVGYEARPNKKGNKTQLLYYLNGGDRYVVSRIAYNVQDTAIARILRRDTTALLLRPGMPFSVSRLNEERERMASLLRNNGYYKFRKEYITYQADTSRHSTEIHLTLNVQPYGTDDEGHPQPHPAYRLNRVRFVADATAHTAAQPGVRFDSVASGSNYIYFREGTLRLRPSLLVNRCFLEGGNLYAERDVQRTYRSFARLGAIKYSNIRFAEASDSLLDATLFYEHGKQHSLSFEVEGTNTAGDLGVAASVSLLDKNLFGGSELLTLKLRGAYEAISGLEGYSGDNYFEYGAELSLRFPGFIMAYFNKKMKKRTTVTTQLSLQFNSQERPEFERQVLSAGWSYQWSTVGRAQHKLDLIDVSYIYVPWISETFKSNYLDSISNRNSILKYNYENLLITKMGYTYSFNSSDGSSFRRFTYSLRAGIESSGNLLTLLNRPMGLSRNDEGQHTFMNIAYAQYVKGDLNFTASLNIDRKNSLLLHMGVGVAYPYGNSRILPFEKRYFAGGANSLRGWTIRSLGPGTFASTDRGIDFINQSGDMKLDLSLEYRTHLFWKINGAAFVDAGNIWTLRDYTEQRGGRFVPGKFYDELALSYGMGMRMELDFIILRLDGGMKAVNPAYTGIDKYPLLHPRMGRDFALHFAVGYPF